MGLARLVLVGLALAGLLPRAPPPPADQITVVDGDTFRLPDGRRVRLPGVDTPESGRPLAAEATALARRFLAAGPAELVPGDPPRDHYGRLLADARVGDDSLSAALVAAGLAWVYHGEAPELLPLQVRAVRRRLGVHAGLDRVRGGPWLVTGSAFHAPDCPLLRSRAAHLPREARLAPLLEAGLSPCRVCLRWPPFP